MDVRVLMLCPDGFILSRDVSRKPHPLWGFSGGEDCPGEKPEDAANREVYEETGVRLPKNSLLYLGAIKKNDHKQHYFLVVLSFVPSHLSCDKAFFSADHWEEARIFSPGQLLDLFKEKFGWKAKLHLENAVGLLKANGSPFCL